MPRLEQLFAGLSPDYRECGPTDEVDALHVDSRQVTARSAFVAVAGETTDGHRFLDQARRAGARVVIVEAGRATPTGPQVVLADTHAALPTIAANYYDWPGRALQLAGITGTNGKTTVSFLLASIFAAAGLTHLRLGTTGNWLADHEEEAAFTTPFPLELQALLDRGRTAGATHGVMEVSSHALAQARVAPLEYRAVGLTSFSQDHLDFHPDMESYLAAKCRLAAEHLAPGGIAVAALAGGAQAARRFTDTARTRGAQGWLIARDTSSSAEVYPENLTIEDHGHGSRMKVITPRGDIDLRSPLVGAFNLDNLMVSAALARALDIDADAISEGLRDCHGAPGRLERIPPARRGQPQVFVDYAHTPAAVERALETLRHTTQGRLFIVLGCGGDRDRSKRPLMGEAAARGSDVFVATSDNPRTEDPERILDDMLKGLAGETRVQREVDRAKAIRATIDEASPGDTVLIAGKGHEDYQILGTTKIDFDDRVHARAALAAKS